MSEGPDEVLRRVIDAFNEEGFDAALEYLDPDVQWLAPPEWLEDRLYEGRAGVRRLADFWSGQFDEYRVEPEQFIDLGGNRVLLLAHQHGRIRSSDTPVEQPVGWIVEVRGGKLVRVDVFFSWEAARTAAGLPE
jgi:ketosteroid isomerase-like protein